MDSLISSTIGLAAGGWDKVKLVGIYTAGTTGIPTWKLGVCNITTMSSGGGALSNQGLFGTVAPFSSIIVAPGATITYVIGFSVDGNKQNVSTRTSTVSFTANSIAGTNHVSVLFNW